VPVVIDNTSERYACVPEKFRAVQCAHLPAGETRAAFIERVKRLLPPESASARSAGSAVASAVPAPRADPPALRAVYVAIAAAVLLVEDGLVGGNVLCELRVIIAE
jgi:hypothetical protein